MVNSVKTTSMENDSTGVIGKNKALYDSKIYVTMYI